MNSSNKYFGEISEKIFDSVAFSKDNLFWFLSWPKSDSNMLSWEFLETFRNTNFQNIYEWLPHSFFMQLILTRYSVLYSFRKGVYLMVKQQKHVIKKVQDKMALVQKRARRKSARQMGAIKKSANLLGLLGLLYFIIHFSHVNFLLWISGLSKKYT